MPPRVFVNVSLCCIPVNSLSGLFTSVYFNFPDKRFYGTGGWELEWSSWSNCFGPLQTLNDCTLLFRVSHEVSLQNFKFSDTFR